MGTSHEVDVVVVGAGFSGLYAVHLLRKQGLSIQGFEAGDDVGGTWYWNRYPGARCDIESIYYCYSWDEELAREWQWSERYAAQPEILAYANRVADKHDLRSSFIFNTRVEAAEWDDEARRWTVRTSDGETWSARFVVLGVGALSAANIPDMPGLANYTGAIYHTGQWPHEGVDFSGLKVGVIGTGSSGIQVIPKIAEQAASMTVFQRTANFTMPAHNTPADPEQHAEVVEDWAGVRQRMRQSSYGLDVEPPTQSLLEVPVEEARATFDEKWQEGTLTSILQAYNDIVRNPESNQIAADYVRDKIREIVHDPQVAEDLVPSGYHFGTKRPCLDTNYFDTFNRENVELVNVRRDPIVEVTATGIRTEETEREFDAIVFATGFDAMTGPVLSIDIHGRETTMAEKWADGPVGYLGLQSAGFPNLFTVTGPGSPSVLSNVVVSIEQHVEFIADLLAHLREQGAEVVEATPEAETEWSDHVQQVAGYTLYPQTDSWLMGANIPGKPRVFLPYIGGVGNFRAKCDAVAANGYEGFRIS
ncbi:flavin-containing monooxygenase [Enemella sp. A6]|uniref:flavin-containing monooxygenase n=1 Tax=Enemella sp. A6 TaxID=3440152 RepID=UPI003EBBF12B